MEDDGFSEGSAGGTLPDVPGYRLLGEIGRGGTAVVYRAEDVTTHQKVAIKLVMNASKGLTTRLRREFEALKGLSHPNVVRGFAVVEWRGGLPCLVLELVEGPTLAQILAEGALSEDERFFIADGILEGVRAAHAAGLIHRDLKPSNVLCAVSNGQFVPKIADFGLVKDVDGDGDTHTGSVLGTPQYMAPEQVRDSRAVDGRADVFALGVMLYELVTGIQPFVGDHLTVLANSAMGTFIPPRTIRAGIADHTELAIMGAMQPDPAQRVPDVACLQALWRGQTSLARYRLPEETRPYNDLGGAERLGRPLRRATTGGSLPSYNDPVPPPPPPRRTGLYVGVGVGLLVVAGLATALLAGWVRGEDGPANVPVPSAAAAVVTPVEVPVPAAVFRLESAPNGATVARDGVVIGTTPLSLPAGANLVGATLELRLEGYRPASATVPAGGGSVSVTLDPTMIQAEAPRPAPKRPPAPARRPVPKSKPVDGDPLLDPWQGD